MATIAIETLDGDGGFGAYLAEPEGTPRGAIVVIQEIFGVNEGIRRKCDHWAIARLCRRRARPVLAARARRRARSRRARAIPAGARPDAAASTRTRAIADIEATIRDARARLPEGGKVGCVGYCLGGRLAFMTAARTDIDASVGYYGVGLEGLMGEKHAIAQPAACSTSPAPTISSPPTSRR